MDGPADGPTDAPADTLAATSSRAARTGSVGRARSVEVEPPMDGPPDADGEEGIQ